MSGRPLSTRAKCITAFRAVRRRWREPQNGEEWAGWVLHHAGKYRIPERIPPYIRQEAEDFLLKVKREATCPSPRS